MRCCEPLFTFLLQLPTTASSVQQVFISDIPSRYARSTQYTHLPLFIMSVRSAAGLLVLAATAMAEVCTTQPGPNLIQNPSFEDGLNQWQANAGYVASGAATDGSYY